MQRDDGEYANQFSSAREAGSPTPPAAAPKMGSRTAPQAGAMPSEQAVSDQLTIRELREMNEVCAAEGPLPLGMTVG